uniref:Uncharacterized protein n=1 Tax=Vespula pensylvanica TaxID=30213 RepID=A0A834NE83_VESPE|nr:hypothetical protein H0235_014531 [Vespula pensylvanica]
MPSSSNSNSSSSSKSSSRNSNGEEEKESVIKGYRKDISRHGLKPLARPTSRRSRYQELMRNPVFKRTWLKPSLQENLAVGSQRAGRKNWSTEFHTESAIYN